MKTYSLRFYCRRPRSESWDWIDFKAFTDKGAIKKAKRIVTKWNKYYSGEFRLLTIVRALKDGGYKSIWQREDKK